MGMGMGGMGMNPMMMGMGNPMMGGMGMGNERAFVALSRKNIGKIAFLASSC